MKCAHLKTISRKNIGGIDIENVLKGDVRCQTSMSQFSMLHT